MMVKIYTGDDIPPAWSSKLVSKLEKADGLSLRGWLEEGQYRVEYWLVDQSAIPGILSILQEVQPIPQSKLGPFALELDIKFRLVDPRTNKALEFQDPAWYANFHPSESFSEVLGHSRALIRLSECSNMYIFLSIPFESIEPQLLEYASTLQKYLPFKMSAKSWRLWKPFRDGRKYSSSRFDLTAESAPGNRAAPAV